MRSPIVTLLVSIGFLFGADRSQACSCIFSEGTLAEQVQESFADATAVFVGTVVDAQLDEVPSRDDASYSLLTQRARFRVERDWKGNFKLGSIVTTETVIECCMCGQSVDAGEVWLIYIHGSGPPYEISTCSRSTPENFNSADIAVLDALTGDARPLDDKKSTEPNKAFEPTESSFRQRAAGVFESVPESRSICRLVAAQR